MKILSLAILHKPERGEAKILTSVSNLADFSFYQKGSVQEFMTFFSKTVADRTAPGQRQSVPANSNIAHVYNRGGQEQLAAVMIADTEYPIRPAFTLLNKIIDDFAVSVPMEKYGNVGSTTSTISFPQLQTYIEKYQDPRQADAIMQVQNELDETKIILHKTIESVLERGTKLDDLVDRSNALSTQSKMFYKTAKKQNSCCIIM